MSDHDAPDYLINGLRHRHGTYSWQGQALQYDQFGPPGEIVYRRYGDSSVWDRGGQSPVDTLLYYDEDGDLAGVLNTYPEGARGDTWVEEPGNVNTFVRPGTIGVNEKLMAEASRRWPGVKEIIAVWERQLGPIPDGGHRIHRLAT